MECLPNEYKRIVGSLRNGENVQPPKGAKRADFEMLKDLVKRKAGFKFFQTLKDGRIFCVWGLNGHEYISCGTYQSDAFDGVLTESVEFTKNRWMAKIVNGGKEYMLCEGGEPVLVKKEEKSAAENVRDGFTVIVEGTRERVRESNVVGQRFKKIFRETLCRVEDKPFYFAEGRMNSGALWVVHGDKRLHRFTSFDQTKFRLADGLPLCPIEEDLLGRRSKYVVYGPTISEAFSNLDEDGLTVFEGEPAFPGQRDNRWYLVHGKKAQFFEGDQVRAFRVVQAEGLAQFERKFLGDSTWQFTEIQLPLP